MKKQGRYKINYRMWVKAKARGDISQLPPSIAAKVNMRGKKHEGEIAMQFEEKERLFIVALGESSIAVDLFTDATLENPKKEMLLKILEVFSMSNGIYEISLSDVYKDIVESLCRSQISYYSNAIKETNASEYSDIILAKRIISLKRRNEELENSMLKLHGKLSRMAPEIIIARLGHGYTIDEIVEYTGLDRKEVNAAIGELPKLGYKAMESRSGRLSVVKL